MINVFNSPIEASSLDEFHKERGDKNETVFGSEVHKRKPQVEYMEDGRKKVDGKVENATPDALWTTTISRGVANEWRNQAEGTTGFQRAKRLVQDFSYDVRVFIQHTTRDYGTPLLLVANVVLLVIVLYMFKVIVW